MHSHWFREMCDNLFHRHVKYSNIVWYAIFYLFVYACLVFIFNMEYATARHDDVVGWFDQNKTEQSRDIIPGIS